MNHDTTNGNPYPRVTSLSASYPPPPAQPTITYNQVMAITSKEGQVLEVANTQTQHVINVDYADIQKPIQLFNPMTGAKIEGQFTNYQQLLVVLHSIIRADQDRYMENTNEKTTA